MIRSLRRISRATWSATLLGATVGTWLLRLATGALLALACLQLGLFVYEDLAWRLDADIELQQARCGSCHDASLPRSFAKSPWGWRRTVEAMLSSTPPGQPVASAAVKERISSLLIRRRSADGPLLFKLRCGRCHDASRLDPYYGLAPGALAALVGQHARQYNFAVQSWEGQLIQRQVLKLRPQRATGEGSATARTQLRYEQACGPCHTVSFRYRGMCREVSAGASSWAAVMARMRAKAPGLMAPGDLQALTAYAQRICSR